MLESRFVSRVHVRGCGLGGRTPSATGGVPEVTVHGTGIRESLQLQLDIKPMNVQQHHQYLRAAQCPQERAASAVHDPVG